MMIKIIGKIIGFIGYLLQGLFRSPTLAIKFYSLADKFNNQGSLSLTAYGTLLFKEGKYQEALNKFRKIKHTKKAYLERAVAVNRALCYWKLGTIDKSIGELEEIRSKFDYINEKILTSLGYFYLINNDLDEALEVSKLALEDEPEYAPALDNLGQIYYRKGELAVAEKYFLQALEIKEMVDSKFYLGLIYEEQDKKDEAKEYFQKAAESELSQFSTVSRTDLEEKCREYGIDMDMSG